MKTDIQNSIHSFSKQRILVIGDAMLDSYLIGNASRICREAPVPIVDIEKRQEVPGGGANAAVNVAALGADVVFVSVVGADDEGEILGKALQNLHVSPSYLFKDTKRKTLTKRRIIAGDHLVVRFDYGSTSDVSEAAESHIIDNLVAEYEHADAVIISDYGYGILTENVMRIIKKLQEKYNKILTVDAKQLDAYRYLSPTFVKPNYQEAVALLGITKPETKEKRVKQIANIKEQLLAITGASVAAVTMDTQGSLVFTNEGTTYRTYTVPVENAKVAGAGDTYASAFTLALTASHDVHTSAEIAAAAAAVIIRKEGTAQCTKGELLASFASSSKHIQNRSLLQDIVTTYKKEGKRIVFTNGCFDILHRGHVAYLNTAKTNGDILIVGVNTDESVKRLKGPQRPINTLEDRMQVLSGLSSVDHVISFHEERPMNLVKIVQPDVYVKGGDYTREQLKETPFVESYGGKVVIIPFVANRSTSNIIKKIRSQPLLSSHQQ